ncbi:MAG TPA: NUDIX hydrolase [Actinocrinis sp.]|nr:NUDIX hydrolase [Actinocrinis sp.]
MLNDECPVVSAAIIAFDGHVLLVRRRAAEGELSWQFPAGEVGPGEDCEQAAVRETGEEVGLTVSPVKFLGQRVHPKTRRKVAYVACTVVRGEATVVDEDELDALAWVDHEELASYVPYGLWEPVQDYLDVILLS